MATQSVRGKMPIARMPSCFVANANVEHSAIGKNDTILSVIGCCSVIVIRQYIPP